MTNKW